MSIGWGITSGRWMAQYMVANANPTLLKKAVIELIDAFEETDRMSQMEVMDRIMQVAMTGKYVPPELEENVIATAVFNLQDGKLTPEDEEEVNRLIGDIDKLLGNDAPTDKSWQDFMDERKKEEDENE